MTSSRHDVARGIAWSLVRTWGSRVVGFLIYFQLARLLSPDDMGLFSAAFAVITLMELLVDQGLIVAVLQKQTISDRQLNTVFAINVSLGVTIAIVIGAFSSSIERLLKTPGLSQIVGVSCVSLAFSSLGMCQEALARRALDFKLLATRTLISTSISGCAAVILAYHGFGVWSLVIQYLIASLINTILLWINPRWKPSLSFDTRELGSLLSTGTNIMGLRLVGYAGGRGIDLVVGVSMGPAALGIFAVGGKLQYIFQQLLGTALVDVAYPTFSRLQTNPVRLREVHLASIKGIAMLSMPAWALLSACSEEIIPIAFGGQWTGAVEILRILALQGALQMLAQFDNAALNSVGNASTAFKLGIINTSTSLITLLLFGTKSLLDASLCLLAAQLFMVPLYVGSLYKTIGTPPMKWMSAVMPAIIGAMLLFVSIHEVRSILVPKTWPPLANLLALSCIGLITYTAALLLIARGDVLTAVRQARGLSKV